MVNEDDKDLKFAIPRAQRELLKMELKLELAKELGFKDRFGEPDWSEFKQWWIERKKWDDANRRNFEVWWETRRKREDGLAKLGMVILGSAVIGIASWAVSWLKVHLNIRW